MPIHGKQYAYKGTLYRLAGGSFCNCFWTRRWYVASLPILALKVPFTYNTGVRRDAHMSLLNAEASSEHLPCRRHAIHMYKMNDMNRHAIRMNAKITQWGRHAIRMNNTGSVPWSFGAWHRRRDFLFVGKNWAQRLLACWRGLHCST